jgi:hypothetical protein
MFSFATGAGAFVFYKDHAGPAVGVVFGVVMAEVASRLVNALAGSTQPNSGALPPNHGSSPRKRKAVPYLTLVEG